MTSKFKESRFSAAPAPCDAGKVTQYNKEKARSQDLQEFMKRTGIEDESYASDILHETEWDLGKALDAYSSMSLTPVPELIYPGNETNSNTHNIASNPLPETKPRVDKGSLSREQRFHRGFSTVVDAVDGLYNDNVLAKLSANNSSRVEQSDTTFMLPDLTSLDDHLIEYIEDDLIDFVTQNILERTGFINWWAGRSLSSRLWCLSTQGDGNCLLHAASLAMWGYQDKTLVLRSYLHKRLQKETKDDSLYRRWRWQQTQCNKEMLLELSEKEWDDEWQSLVQLSSAESRVKEYKDPDSGELLSTSSFDFLEEFHVFVLAQILHRPIIVFADNVIRDVDGYPLSPLPFGGIYLPLLCDVEECFKSPILLAYDHSHFTAVVTKERSKNSKQASLLRDLVPLTNESCGLLPIHFVVDPGKNVDWQKLGDDDTKASLIDVMHLLQTYLNVKNIPLNDLMPSASSGSSDSLSGPVTSKDGVTTKTKSKKSFISRKKSSKPPKEQSKFHVDREPNKEEAEFEPDMDMIMSVSLKINTPTQYEEYIRRYLKSMKEKYNEKKSQGLLKDMKKKPPIATKLSVSTNHSSGRESPSAISPSGGVVTLCKKCNAYQGTPDQNNLCSICYKLELPAPSCPNCKSYYGTADNKGYCSECYKKILSGDMIERPPEKPRKRLVEYEVPISSYSSLGTEGIDEDHYLRNQTIQGCMEQLQPARFPTDIIGNSDLLPSYDKTNSVGYLRTDYSTKYHDADKDLDRSYNRDYDRYYDRNYRHRPSPTDYRPSSTDYRPSSTDYRPSSTDYRPSPTDYRPSPTDYRPSSTDYRPSSTDYRPSPTDYRPSPTDYRPSPTDLRPSSTARPLSSLHPVTSTGNYTTATPTSRYDANYSYSPTGRYCPNCKQTFTAMCGCMRERNQRYNNIKYMQSHTLAKCRAPRCNSQVQSNTSMYCRNCEELRKRPKEKSSSRFMHLR